MNLMADGRGTHQQVAADRQRMLQGLPGGGAGVGSQGGNQMIMMGRASGGGGGGHRSF